MRKSRDTPPPPSGLGYAFFFIVNAEHLSDSGAHVSMAAYAESNASFRFRAKQIQLTDAHLDILDDNDIKCFNHLAFACNGQPGQLDPGRFQQLEDLVCPRGATLGVHSALKQLAYEALTVAVAAIKQRIETPDEVGRKLPPQEMDERLRKIREKITGFDISGDYEPAHSVVNAFAQMLDEAVLKVLPLSKCISREQELLSVKQDKQVVHLEGQQLQIRNKTSELTTELGNELKVHQAFVRRGLALEMANLGTYNVHEKVVREFMSHLTRPVPPGFKGPNIEAILRADKELWLRVSDQVRSGLRPDGANQLPVDKALLDLYMSPAVLFHVLPLPSTGGQKLEPGNKRKADADEKAASSPKPSSPKKPRKGQKNRQQRTNLPSGLHGFSGVNAQKQRICYNYSLPHGCKNTTSKEGNFDKCNRGMHQCIKCHGKHSHVTCNN